MMRRKTIFFSLLLCVAAMVAQTPPTLVPAMIVHSADGNRQVVPLETTDITDLIVQQKGQTLSVAVPEAEMTGIRSITFAMVDAKDVEASIESVETTAVNFLEKVVRDGRVIIRLKTDNGTILEYDILGNQINKINQ